MKSFVVLAAHSRCGPMTIKASSPETAAQLYNDSCCDSAGDIWVWHASDYHSSPGQRPDPLEFGAAQLQEDCGA